MCTQCKDGTGENMAKTTLFTWTRSTITPRCCLLFFLLIWIFYSSILNMSTKSKTQPLELNKYWDHSQQACSHHVFREYYKQFDRFPAGGKWKEFIERGSKSAFYASDVCKLKYFRLRPSFARQCFQKANVSSIVTLGDSNGQRYFFNFIDILKSFSNSCLATRKEKLKSRGLLPDRAYFTRADPLLERIVQVHYRYCGGCGGMETACNWTSPSEGNNLKPSLRKTTIEHLPMTGVLDNTVTTLVPFEMYHNKSTSYMTQTHSTTNSPEFFFKLYLKDRYPDIICVFMTFNHVKSPDPFERFEADIRYFHSLVKVYIPRTTRVFYIPGFREFEHARKSEFWRNKTFNGLLAWQRIAKLNQILFEVIKEDLLNPKMNVHGFFDMVLMSETRGNWSTDGVHMEPQWYKYVITYLFETFCNTILNN